MKRFIARAYYFISKHQTLLFFTIGVVLILFSQREVKNDSPLSFWIGVTMCVLSFHAISRENEILLNSSQRIIEEKKLNTFKNNALQLSIEEIRELKKLFRELDTQRTSIKIEPLLYEDPRTLSQACSGMLEHIHSEEAAASPWDPEPLRKDSYDDLPGVQNPEKNSSTNNDP